MQQGSCSSVFFSIVVDNLDPFRWRRVSCEFTATRSPWDNVGIGMLEIPVLRFRIIDKPIDHIRVVLQFPSQNQTHKKPFVNYNSRVHFATQHNKRRRRCGKRKRRRYHISVRLELLPEIRRLRGRGEEHEVRSASTGGADRKGGRGEESSRPGRRGGGGRPS
jgi:hypothetical protein